MKLNFSLQKAGIDLVGNKVCQWILFFILIFLIILNSFRHHFYFGINLFKSLGCFIFAGVLAVMANNIINGNEPIIKNIFIDKEELRKTSFAILNFFLIGFVYSIIGILFILLVCKLAFIFFGSDMKNAPLPAFIILLLLPTVLFLPFFPFIPIFVNLLFSESLNLKDCLNFAKGFKSIKYAWIDYMLAFLLFALFWMISSIILGIIPNNVFSPISFILGCYFYNHILAQIYKYSLSKMNEIN